MRVARQVKFENFPKGGGGFATPSTLPLDPPLLFILIAHCSFVKLITYSVKKVSVQEGYKSS